MLKLKTYCWNHCTKIIFKCVNSAVGPIFNEKIDKKWNLWVREQYTNILFTENWSNVVATVHVPYMNSSRKWGENAWNKKKKKKKENAETETQETANPNTHLIYELGSSEIWYNFNKSIVELHLLLMTYMLATFKITKD